MKYTMLTALQAHAALLDKNIQAAVENYCTPDNIQRVITQIANEALNNAVKEEVRNFFRFSGVGRKAVREAVQHWLDEQYPPEGDD